MGESGAARGNGFGDRAVRAQQPDPAATTPILLGPTTDRPPMARLVDYLALGSRTHGLAVVAGDSHTTHRELWSAAEDLADRLKRAGVREGVIVPLLLKSSRPLPLAILATTIAGGVFVPMDAGWHRDRVAAAMSVANASVLVEERADGSLAVRTTGEPTIRFLGHEACYGYFTSGSSGTPKLALNTHEGIINRLAYMSDRFSADGERVLQNSAHTFDSSLWQVLWPISRGATCYVPDRQGVTDVIATLEAIDAYSITMTDFVPSVLRVVVDHLEAARPARTSLRRLFVGGETCSPDVLRRLWAIFPEIRVTNTYGPTETAIGSVFHEIRSSHAAPIPVGTPIANTAVAVVDESGHLVEPGERGEIYIGGRCLGLGYVGAAEETRRRFVPNRISGMPGSVLYRTGDFGYVSADRELIFLGRQDRQVKVGGVRVELASVEAEVERHPLINAAGADIVEVEGSPVLAMACAAEVNDEGQLRQIVRGMGQLPVRPDIVTLVPTTPPS